MNHIAERLADVRGRITAAAERAGRSPEHVCIVAVSKRHPASVIELAQRAGLRHIGESYVQEMVSKMDQVQDPGAISWHFIGHLQRNKVKQVVGRAALIHAVDSERLAREIHKRAAAAGVVQPVLIEVNLAGEASKSGVSPQGAPGLVALVAQLGAVECAGLMAMPPMVSDPEDNRRYFRALRTLRDRLRTSDQPLEVLSMGTTHDYTTAVEEGATHVRIGTAIFGPRPG